MIFLSMLLLAAPVAQAYVTIPEMSLVETQPELMPVHCYTQAIQVKERIREGKETNESSVITLTTGQAITLCSGKYSLYSSVAPVECFKNSVQYFVKTYPKLRENSSAILSYSIQLCAGTESDIRRVACLDTANKLESIRENGGISEAIRLCSGN